MKVLDINDEAKAERGVTEAIKVLRSGGTVIIPTDTVYGLAANACDNGGVSQIYKIKRRAETKPLPVLIRSTNWAKEVAFVPPKLEPYLSEIWPGPVTIILPGRDVVSAQINKKDKSIGLRVADYAFIDRLLAVYGYPLAATSANISGEESPYDPVQIIKGFEGEIWKPDLILDRGPLPKNLSSTVIDFTKIKPKILRAGPVNPEMVKKILGLGHI